VNGSILQAESTTFQTFENKGHLTWARYDIGDFTSRAAKGLMINL